MTCKIILKDEVNCKIEGLDLDTRKKCEKELKFFCRMHDMYQRLN